MSDIEDKNLPVSVVITDKIDPDSLDEMTARVKVKMVDELTKGGRVIPSDDDGVNTLLKVLGSIDTQTNNRRKIAVEERAVDVASRAAANVAEVIKQSKGKNPFVGEKEVNGEVVGREPTLPDMEPVSRQDYVGIDNLAYEDFINDNA